jgi:protein-tyrosine-phosphatase
MAEAIFNALASDAGVPYEARSAGTAALVGEPMTPHAAAVLEEVGVYPGKHRARQVDAAMLEGADLVLAMTPQHASALRRISAEGKIHTLLGYAYAAPEAEGISDPIGQPVSAYRASVRRIIEGVDRVVSRLESR